MSRWPTWRAYSWTKWSKTRASAAGPASSPCVAKLADVSKVMGFHDGHASRCLSAAEVGERVAGRHQDAERVLAEQQRGDLRRGERGAADADVEAAVQGLPGIARERWPRPG
jgi:hypothetical protein